MWHTPEQYSEQIENELGHCLFSLTMTERRLSSCCWSAIPAAYKDNDAHLRSRIAEARRWWALYPFDTRANSVILNLIGLAVVRECVRAPMSQAPLLTPPDPTVGLLRGRVSERM